MGNLKVRSTLNPHLFGLNLRKEDRETGFHSEVVIEQKLKARSQRSGVKTTAGASTEKLPHVHWRSRANSAGFYYCLWSFKKTAGVSLKLSSMFPLAWSKEAVKSAIETAVEEWNDLKSGEAESRRGSWDWKGKVMAERNSTIWIGGYASSSYVDTAFPILEQAPAWVAEGGSQSSSWTAVSKSARQLRQTQDD